MILQRGEVVYRSDMRQGTGILALGQRDRENHGVRVTDRDVNNT